MRKIWKPGWLLKLSFLAAVAVPIGDLGQWKNLKFNKIPANTIASEGGTLKITVSKSSSPVVYKFPEKTKIKGFKVKAKWTGALNIPDGKTQGSKGADDFVLKFGLVEAGKETLNWFQKKVAADWILELYKMAPKGAGVRRINFYSTTLQKDQVGKSRTHPLSDLLYEERLLYLEGPGEFELTKEFENPMESLGIWLSVDGDDTESSFELVITSVEIF